jgi:DNA-binding transcriptional MerR regulator
MGRQVVYSNLQLSYGLLIRALVDGGVSLEAVGEILGRLSPDQVQSFAIPLTAIVEARTQLQTELAYATRQLRPAEADLDFKDLRLEDPVALQAQMSASESEFLHINRRLEDAFAAVRTRVLADVDGNSSNGPMLMGANPVAVPISTRSDVDALRSDVQALTATIRDLALIIAAQADQDPKTQTSARTAAERLRHMSEKKGAIR